MQHAQGFYATRKLLFLLNKNIRHSFYLVTMAEVAGLAIAVLSLIGSFKTCIDLFSCFVAARSLSRSYEILSAKLNIEKALLLQWAHRTNLLKPRYDERLDEPRVRAAVGTVISSIELLLSDSQNFQQRYGLQEMKDRELNIMFILLAGIACSLLQRNLES